MGMISRYKKPGGFKQLLELVETSGKIKQDKFMVIINEEDPNWARAIQERMLTLDKILCWSDQIQAEIFSRLTDIKLGIFSHILTDEQWEKATVTFSHAKLHQIKDLFADKEPTVPEQTTAIVNVLTEVRTMINEGMIRLEVVDPTLIVEDYIEDNLVGSEQEISNNKVANISAEVDKVVKGSEPNSDAIKKVIGSLKKKVIVLGNENHNLRRENEALRRKIDQIKKLAA